MNLSLNSSAIRALRCRFGWCQSELAQRLGVTSSEIRAWELGERTPDLLQRQILESLFRQSETSILEILQTPTAETLLDSTMLESVVIRDLVRDNQE